MCFVCDNDILMCMNRSEAAKKRIGKTKKERSDIMANIARVKWYKMSSDDQYKHIIKMVNGRKNK